MDSLKLEVFNCKDLRFGGVIFGEFEFFCCLLGLPPAPTAAGIILAGEGLALPLVAGDPFVSGFDVFGSQYWLYALIRYFADSLGPSGWRSFHSCVSESIINCNFYFLQLFFKQFQLTLCKKLPRLALTCCLRLTFTLL